MLPSCREIAEQASDNIDEPLTGIRRLKMMLHLFICVNCRRYKEQIFLSSRAVKSLEHNIEPNKQLQANVEACYKELHCKHKEKQD